LVNDFAHTSDDEFTACTVLRLIAAAIIGIPLGIYAVRRIDEEIVLTVLGLNLMGDGLRDLLDPRSRPG
jgi:ABC-type dipeptide/oligopeptide/nickel transport system permease subunit